MDPAFTYQLGDTSLSCELDLVVDDGIQVVLPPVVKRPNTVRDISQFVCEKNAEQFLVGVSTEDVVSKER
jgi:hypothetical protein